MDKNIEEFWNRLNLLIKEHKYTQTSLALLCNFNTRRIQNLSSGNRYPDLYEAVQIAKALNTSVEYLVLGDTEQPTTDTRTKLLNIIHLLENEINNL